MSKTAKKISLIILTMLCMTSILIGVAFIPISNNSTGQPFVDKMPNPTEIENNNNEFVDVELNEFYHENGIASDGTLLAPFDVVYPDAFATGEHNYSKDHLLLKMPKSFDGKLTTKLANCGIDKIEKSIEIDDGIWYKANVDTSKDINQVVKDIRQNKLALIVDYDYEYKTEAVQTVDNSPVYATATPPSVMGEVADNTQVATQWYLHQCGIPQAWQFLKDNGISPGGLSSVVVAVIDTGVDYNHPDLKANMWVNQAELNGTPGVDDDNNGYVDDIYGINAVANNGYADMENVGNPMDDHGHGTHVAGIIAASNNKEGIVGIAYNARIMAIKAGQASGVFNQSDIAEAILYAYQNGADVINMSFGGSSCSIAVQDALKQAYTTCSLVAAAGNDGFPNEDYPTRPLDLPIIPNYPAALSYVIGVMSVDNNGVESVFSNFDGLPFTRHEYEVYAPGENIMSTLPNGKYAKLSGTSMSAPVVSGLAALLRSYFTDRDKYPSKYIMAQLSATSEDTAKCFDPSPMGHGIHNLPMIVNGYSALTKLPTPEVRLHSYEIFDSKSISNINNEDGIVDAGETINIGAVLRNRWGMSKDTIITIDAIGDLGINNPYVEILTDTAIFDGVGTYSIKDKFIRDKQNIITGTEQPLVIKIKENCPNDYLVVLNVKVTCANALDEKDSSVYETKAKISFMVRNGVVLPSQITEDMVLTSENYYIIPNSTYIAPNVTVTVEPGTKIQFWTDDPRDPYSDQYMASLSVAGKFITKGTAENPVEMFPSELMSDFRVEITNENVNGVDGIIGLNYTNITNPNVKVNQADHCKIDKNNDTGLYIRVLNNGIVQTLIGFHASFDADKCNNSVFYKLNLFYLYGVEYNNCIFTDSTIKTEGPIFTNCVFEDNNRYNGDKLEGSSIKKDIDNINIISMEGSYANKTYCVIGNLLDKTRAQLFAKYIGGSLAVFETKEELDSVNVRTDGIYTVDVMVDYDGNIKWHDGSPIGDFINIQSIGERTGIYQIDGKYFMRNINGRSYFYVEIPNKDNGDGTFTPWTQSELWSKYEEWENNGIDFGFSGNVILNNFNDTNPEHWLRVVAKNADTNTPTTNVNGNYWGTTDKEMIEKQIVDFDDFNTLLKDIVVDNYLTTPPSNTFPFVVDAYLLNSNGERAKKVSNETVTFVVEFNRDMDTSIPLRVRFGSSEPYAEYEIKNGKYVNPRRWEGTYTLTTTIENGQQFINVENACAADDAFLKLYATPGRLSFEIDTTLAQAMVMQGEATPEGINLTWMQDDFATLAGYNVYRSDKKDGLYTRLNDVVLDPATKTFFDNTVEPGRVYYYNFTVVQTDLTESKPSGKIVIQSFDTMAPGVHHSPVRVGYTGSNLTITATITDNLMIKSADVYYRTVGTLDWKKLPMKAVNSRYMVTIPASDLSLDGLEYYIDAFDGVNHTYNGTVDNPHTVIIKVAVSDNSLGDVDGNGIIENKDALMLLQAANDMLNLTDEQFARADINKDKVLSAAEALRILQYVSGKVTTIV